MRCSLATSDEAVGRQRQGLALAHLETVWQNLRTGPATLSQRRINALSGEVYRLFKDRFEENPGTPEMWIAAVPLIGYRRRRTGCAECLWCRYERSYRRPAPRALGGP
ncbi:hypothetical protein K32_03760 [Kaistia sp. 32K]|nr:hypothetical protein K32_03760 [Kaistia sp. 32K]